MSHRNFGKAPAALCAVLLISGVPVLAQAPTRYFYDDANQLFRALDSTGTLLEWIYDSGHNITQVNRSVVSLTSLAIFNVTPLRGAPGTMVRIYGQNFNTTPGSNVVMFNGVAATVVSATSTMLIVIVPSGGTTGTITITVNGQTVTSGTLQFSGPLSPTITSLIPDGGITGTSLNLAVVGTNLDNATFAANPGGVLTFNAVTTSSSATGLASITGAAGLYAVVATNAAGSSSNVLGPNNRFIILDAAGEGDSFVITVLNKAAPPAGTPDPTLVSNEASSRIATVLNLAAPPPGTADPTLVSHESTSQTATVLNTSPPPAGAADPTLVSNEADSPIVTVFNSSSSSGSSPTSSARRRGTIRTPGIMSGNPAGVPDLVAGQTVTAAFEVPDGFDAREVDVFVNGTLFETNRAPSLETTFTVPAGIPAFTLRAVVRNAAGKELAGPLLNIPVRPDPHTTVTGRVVDGAGRRVVLEAQGWLAEFFDFDRPLAAEPELDNRAPGKTALVSGLSLKNPRAVFGLDPLGLGLAPDYAARYRTEIAIETPGRYAFYLRSHAGASLKVDGISVTQDADLLPGPHQLEVLSYENTGAYELDLTWAPPDSERQPIPSVLLTARDEAGAVRTNAAGEFAFSNVQASLDQVQVRVPGDAPVVSAPAKPNAAGATRIEEVRINH